MDAASREKTKQSQYINSSYKKAFMSQFTTAIEKRLRKI